MVVSVTTTKAVEVKRDLIHIQKVVSIGLGHLSGCKE